MVYCKKFFILFLILFILFFNFSSVFASETDEEVSLIYVRNTLATSNSNVFVSDASRGLQYFSASSDYIYTIHVNNNLASARVVVSSSDIPAVNGSYTILFDTLSTEGQSFTIRPVSDTYISISLSVAEGDITVTRSKVGNMSNTIQELADNVGPNAFWGVFGSGLDFIFIVVIVAFGLFIIYKLIKGLSKGKSKI